MSQVPQVFQETEVPQEPLASDLRGLQERRVSRVSQEDLEVPAHPVRRQFQVYFVYDPNKTLLSYSISLIQPAVDMKK